MSTASALAGFATPSLASAYLVRVRVSVGVRVSVRVGVRVRVRAPHVLLL